MFVVSVFWGLFMAQELAMLVLIIQDSLYIAVPYPVNIEGPIFIENHKLNTRHLNRDSFSNT